MRRKIGILVLVFVAMILIAGLVGLFVPAATPSPKRPLKPLPNPNGYDTLLQAGSMIPGPLPEYDKMSHDELVSLTDANSNAVQLARIGLNQECELRWLTSESWSNHLSCLRGSRRLAFAFAAEGRLAEMEHRPADAANSYLDIIQLGIDSSRGGNLIDAMSGWATEDHGARYLPRLGASLDAKSCREIVSRLEMIDADREQWTNIVAQEYEWMHRADRGVRDRLIAVWFAGSEKTILASEQIRFSDRAAKTRRLSIDLAARAYELEHQQKPASFSDLVPAYLKTIPQDPLTGTNMTLLP